MSEEGVYGIIKSNLYEVDIEMKGVLQMKEGRKEGRLGRGLVAHVCGS